MVRDANVPDKTPEFVVPSGLVVIVLVIFALIFTWLADSRSSPMQLVRYGELALLSYGVAAVAWIMLGVNRRAGEISAIAASISLVVLAAIWWDAPAILALLYLPTLLAGNNLGPLAALGFALVQTGICAVLREQSLLRFTDPEWLVVLFAIWGAWVMAFGLHRQAAQRRQWLESYLAWADGLAREAQDSRAEAAQAVAQLSHDNRELTLANERIAGLRLLAEDAQKAKTEFVTRVSHELRTPLNMIIGLVELMIQRAASSGEVPPEMEEDLGIVLRNSRHLSAMIDDVLDLARSEAGRLMLHREWVDLGMVVGEAAEAVQPLVRRKALRLTVDLAPALPDVYCDRTRIRQVILNLASNAARMTESGGVTIRASSDGKTVTVAVTDTGPGIAVADQERIFQPFEQVGPESWQGRGTSGLGLTISQQFVALHYGRLWVESELGAGSTFVVQLPISEPIEPFAGPGRAISEEWPWHERTDAHTAQLGRGKAPLLPRVMVCDRTGGLKPQLARYNDLVELAFVSDIAQALRIAQESVVSALLVNEETSENTLALAQQAAGETPGLPVVGLSVPAQLAGPIAQGATGYLLKPITIEAITRILQTLPPSPRVLSVDDDRELLRLLARMVATIDPHAQVMTAESGAAALRLLETQAFDLVMLDVVMPEISGWEVLTQLRKNLGAEMPVYIVTAQDPTDRTPSTAIFVAAYAGGLSIHKALCFSLELARLTATPDGQLDPVPPRTAAARPAY